MPSTQQKRDTVSDTLEVALLSALRPIVKLLLYWGLPFRRLGELMQWLYVDVAREQGTSQSAIALKTGLNRRTVAKLAELYEPPERDNSAVFERLPRVLNAWANLKFFQDGRGKPAVLPFAGRKKSFSELVRRFGADVPPRAFWHELLDAGNIEMVDEGHARLVSHAAVRTLPEDQLYELGNAGGHLFGVIFHNMTQTPKRLQREIKGYALPAEGVSAVRQLVDREWPVFSRKILKEINKWDEKHEDAHEQVTLGAYYFSSRMTR